MSTPHTDDRLAQACWEAARHAAVLDEALTQWAAQRRVQSIAAIESDPELRRLADQIVFRFTKLQDAMGERLVPATLASLLEPYENRPVRDRLDRLEKLGYLDVGDWLRWREMRNRLAHEYPDAPELRQAQLLSAIVAAAEIVAAWRRWRGLLGTG